jgi:hypothetical protein
MGLDQELPKTLTCEPIAQLRAKLEAGKFEFTRTGMKCEYSWDSAANKRLSSLPDNSVSVVRNYGNAAYADVMIVYKLAAGVTVTLAVQARRYSDGAFVETDTWNLDLWRMGCKHQLAIEAGAKTLKNARATFERRFVHPSATWKTAQDALQPATKYDAAMLSHLKDLAALCKDPSHAGVALFNVKTEAQKRKDHVKKLKSMVAPTFEPGFDMTNFKNCAVPQPEVFGHVVQAFCGVYWLRPTGTKGAEQRADAVEIAVCCDADLPDDPCRPPFDKVWSVVRLISGAPKHPEIAEEPWPVAEMKASVRKKKNKGGTRPLE